MKLLLSLFAVLLIYSTSYADDSRYINGMKKNIEDLDSAKTFEDAQKIANAFERIANAEKEKWEPRYYIAYANLYMSFFVMDNAKKDECLETAIEYLEKAEEIAGENSEIYALRGFVLMMQISVQPMQRGQTLGPQSAQSIEKSIKLDPSNPRPVLIKGQNLYYTPVQFGGDKTKACELFNDAKMKFDKFKPENEVSPVWGLNLCEQMLQQCPRN